MDNHGNINAVEGCTRCICGGKYWENDVCVSCGIMVEVSELRMQAGQARYLNEMWLNVQLTTWEHYDLGTSVHTLDAVTTAEKFRMMGVIQ